MTRDKQILVGVVVLAALGGLVYLQVKKDQNIGKITETTSADLPEIKGSDDLDKFQIKNGDKGDVTLEKKGDKWVVTKPLEAPASQASVKAMIDSLKELKTKEQLFSQVTDADKKDYQLDAEKGVHLVAWKGADKKLDVTFGKSGARGQLVMVDGKPSVYAATGYSAFVYTRELKGWRDTEILRFDDANVNQVMIENKSGPFSFTRDGEKWSATQKGKAFERFDQEKLKDMLRSYKSLNADDFGDGKTTADTGLDAPEGTITFQLKDGAGKYTLKVGKTGPGANHFAQKDGTDTVFVVSNFIADFATNDGTKFQQPVDGGAPKDKGPPGMGGMPPGMQLPPGMQMPGMPGGDPHGGH